MRILIAAKIPKTIPSGNRRWIEKVAAEMKKLGHEVHCVFAEDVVLALTSYSHHNLFKAFEFPILLIKKIMSLEREKGHFDIVDITNKQGYLFGLLRKRLGMRSKYILRCVDPDVKNIGAKASSYYRECSREAPHDLEVPRKLKFWFSYLYQKQERMAFLKSDKIVVMCEEDHAILTTTAGIDTSKIIVVPLGTDEEFFQLHRNESDLKGDFLFIGGCAGFWGKLEGIDFLAEAFPKVVKKYPKAKLTIVGCCDADETAQYFASSLKKNIRIYPFVSRRKLVQAYAEHKILVHPSLSESFGMVFLDGLAAGLTVITTPVGGAADICEDRKDSLIIPPGNSKSLADAMIFLLENEDVRKVLGRKAREKARGYTWKQVAIKTLKFYEDTMTEG